MGSRIREENLRAVNLFRYEKYHLKKRHRREHDVWILLLKPPDVAAEEDEAPLKTLHISKAKNFGGNPVGLLKWMQLAPEKYLLH